MAGDINRDIAIQFLDSAWGAFDCVDDVDPNDQVGLARSGQCKINWQASVKFFEMGNYEAAIEHCARALRFLEGDL